MIKLLLSDIDGVLTDGKKTYNNNGICIGKTFNDKDWTGFKKFKSSGVYVCLISGDEFINRILTKNRNIDFIFSNKKNKRLFLNDICHNYKVEKEEILYIGDDIFDISIMKECGYKACPKNSSSEILAIASIILGTGGDGIINELFDICLKKSLVDPYDIIKLSELDKNEKL
jgi:3-deoxy-D-manno-octulosonate 8-phosphate phosphatase (KDO 8-P phosphatase)